MAEIAAFGPLVRRDGEPAFEEAWQAELLALAYALADRGVFSPSQWSEALGAALRRAAADGAPDDQATYYTAALAALERLLATDGRLGPAAVTARTEQWRAAYLATPHGQPVELAAGVRGGGAEQDSHRM